MSTVAARSSADLSTTSLEGPERKRRRKVLSCLGCRRRKLQCDRALPACGRCTKAGKADDCLYIDDAHNDPQHQSIDQDMVSRLESRDRRIKELETALAQRNRQLDRFPPTPESALINESSTDRENMLLRGGAFKTKYFGSTHPGLMISYIPELNNFTKEAFERFPALGQMRAEAHALYDKHGEADIPVSNVQDDEIRALMVSKLEADELVHLYVDTFETIYHILHLPTFWKAYEEMWNDISSTPVEFVATVLLMMACVSCLSTQPQRYVAKSSTARNKALLWLRHCEGWLGRQSQKHVTAADFQLRCFLWLGRQTSARKFKRSWTEAGSLLRFFMSAGLHRNPNLLQKETSPLDKELRRRLWATAVDFELQSSFDRGMISAPWLLQSDCPGPGNLRDEDLTIGNTPPARQMHEYTLSSYLALANESVMLRSTLNAVLNNIRQTMTFEEVKQYTEEIEGFVSNIPNWTDRRSEMPRALLFLRLKQYLLVLHDRQLRQASSMIERNFSKTILLESALQIIDVHKKLVTSNNFALVLYCLDPLRVAVSIAHMHSFIDPRTDLAFSKAFDIMTPQLMHDAIELIQEKFYRFGREGHQLWISITCDTVIKIRKSPEQREFLMQQAVEKVISPMYKVMACQDMTASAGSCQANGNDTAELKDTMKPVDEASSGTTNPIMLSLDELDDWIFQDWFHTADFQSLYPAGQDLNFDPIMR